MYGTKVKADEIAIDCGANIGDITEHLSKYGGTVYSFEPHPLAFEHLQTRFKGRPNVQCISKAVYTHNSTMKLYLHEGHEGDDNDELAHSNVSSLLDYKPNVSREKYVEVPVLDLCGFIEALGQRVRVLKLDVEGVEGAILQRLIETGIIQRIDCVFVETHENKIPELRGEMDEIRSLIKERRLRNIDLNWI